MTLSFYNSLFLLLQFINFAFTIHDLNQCCPFRIYGVSVLNQRFLFVSAVSDTAGFKETVVAVISYC